MKYLLMLLSIPVLCPYLHGFDQSRFFQATYYPEKPKFERPHLTSFMIRGGIGNTHKTKDCPNPSALFCTEYQINTIVFDVSHTFCHGFFVNGTLPLYWLHISQPDFTTIKKSHVLANPCLTGGWTINYEDFEHLDFIDFMIESGVITPGKKPYFPDWGIPLRGVIAFGLYEWLTTGLAVDLVEFFKQGRLWDVAWFIEADHVMHGLSLGFGYTYSNQKCARVPWTCAVLPFWNMHTFHFFISYDTASCEHPHFPIVELFYNHVLSGVNIIPTPLLGLSIKVFY